MSDTPNLLLPEFGSAGVPSGLELTRGFRILDAIVQLTPNAFDNAPPGSPALGFKTIVGTSPTGAFIGHKNHIAYYTQDGWQFIVPRNNWLAIFGANSLWVFSESLNVWAQIPLTGAAAGAANITPDNHPVTPNNADDEFETGSAIDLAGTRFSGATAWSWLNQGTLTSVVAQGALTVVNTNQTTTIRGITQAPSGATYRYRSKMSYFTPTNNTGATGMVLARGAKLIILAIGYNNGGFVFIQRYTNATTLASSSFGTVGDVPATRTSGASTGLTTEATYLEVEYDATNVIFRSSGSGYNGTFGTFLSEAAATFLGGAPDAVGLIISGQAVATAFAGNWDWFRKVA
jgi:hypothetical protein